MEPHSESEAEDAFLGFDDDENKLNTGFSDKDKKIDEIVEFWKSGPKLNYDEDDWEGKLV